jgi:hypothetical protein
VFVPEPQCDWHTYDWVDGKSVLGGPKCEGDSGLTAATHGGNGNVASADPTKCVPVSMFGMTESDGVACAPKVKIDQLLSYSCEPSV